MFADLQKFMRMSPEECPEGLPCFKYSEAVRYLGDHVRLEEVSVGRYGTKQWTEERRIYVWCSYNAPDFWLPAYPPQSLLPLMHRDAEDILGLCSLVRTEDGAYVWSADTCTYRTVPALLDIITREPVDYNEACRRLGCCCRHKDEQGQHWWVSASPNCKDIKVPAITPEFQKLPELF